MPQSSLLGILTSDAIIKNKKVKRKKREREKRKRTKRRRGRRGWWGSAEVVLSGSRQIEGTVVVVMDS